MRKIFLALLVVFSAELSFAIAQQTETLWLPESEPSPFIPDKAKWIAAGSPEQGKGWAHTIYLRKTIAAPKTPRRAVFIAAPFQTLRVYLNGEIIGAGYDEREASPLIVDVTERLRKGENFFAARASCVWRPMFYAQLRVEYEDGASHDFITDSSWECAAKPGGDWATTPASSGDWLRAAEVGDYQGRPGQSPWGHRFALLPRDKLRDYLHRHNESLRQSWRKDRNAPRSLFRGQYEKPEYAQKFRDYLRLNPDTGQLSAPDGKPLHLFFTIYNQKRNGGVRLSVPDFDFDQLERDLDLMERAHVNVYLRHLGWSWLLNENGDWAKLKEQPAGKGLPKFDYAYELLDYFLDRAQSHGLYVVVEPNFYWGANHTVIPTPYLTRYYLYPEVAEAQALAVRKMMHHFSSRKNLVAVVVGEEEVILNPDLSNPHLHKAFVDYLRRKYGALSNLKRQWQHGYDYADESQFWWGKRRAEYWEGNPEEEVLYPRYPYRQGIFDKLTDWGQVPLPLWPRYHSVEKPDVPLYGHKSYNNFTPYDPIWIDYYEMREEELLLKMLQRWGKIVKEGCPNQLLFYSNAQDFTNSWHFVHFFRRAEIPFDVIGVGCHDAYHNLSEIPPWATIRKTIKVVASYRPYVFAKGSHAMGVASGEGAGGHVDQPEEVLNYYRGALFDEIGGGCAWTQTYDWLYISDGHGNAPPHLSSFLRWMSEFMPIAERARFSLRRDAPILIVRNKNLQHSNRSGLDYGNARSLANFLGQLNIELDIVMDQDLCYLSASQSRQADKSGEKYKIDLANYRLVFLPSVSADYPEPVWKTLDAWLSDDEYAGKRALCIGLIEKRSPYLAPRPEFHPLLQKWLGVKDYAGDVSLRGKQALTFGSALGGVAAGTPLELDFGRAEPSGILNAGRMLLRTSTGKAVVCAFDYAGNRIYACGFTLGLAYNELWGMEPRQPTYDALTPLLEGIVDELGIERRIRAPHNVRVYVSDDQNLILAKERYGIATEIPCEIKLPEEAAYSGCETERLPDGFTRFRAKLAPYGGLYFQKKR